MQVLRELGKLGLIPVAVLDRAVQAVPLARALERGGLPAAEITLRTSAGIDSIRAISEEMPEFMVGAGTVLTLEQCEAAIDAGASYIVSPGFNLALVDYCQKRDVAVIPGCATPSEIEMALAHGIHAVKFFPASTYGGATGCKALYAPYAHAGIRFIPTGGISLQNLSDYSNKAFIHAIGGGWLTPKDAIENSDWDRITHLAYDSIVQLLGFELAHIGVNLENEKEALDVSEQFENYFGWKAKNGNSSIFSSSCIEVLKSSGRGVHGHLAIRTNSVERALYYLEKRGMCADEESIKYQDGVAKFAYMRDQIAGFAVHLLQK